MIVVFARTLVFYGFLMSIMRLMGKRQIGEIQLPELVVTLMLSELAVLPITDRDIPIFHGIVALLTLAILEVLVAYLCKRFPVARKVFAGEPMILIDNGLVHEKNLKKSRITLEEVFSQIRIAGYKDIGEVQYVILEQTGRMSILPKAEFAPLSPSEMNVEVTEIGVTNPVIVDGQMKKVFLKASGKSVGEVEKILNKNNVTIKEVLYLTFDDNGKATLVLKRGVK